MILYFSGTGNSNYVAKRIADALGDEIVNLNDRIKAGDTSPVKTGERVIIVTPTYAWRIPRVVCDWLLKTELRGTRLAWFVMTCGSEIGNAGELHCDVFRAAGGRSAGNRRQGRTEYRLRHRVNSEQSAVRSDTKQALRPLYEQRGQSDFLQILRQSERLYRVKRLHRLRAVREALSDEQRCNQRWQAGLGQKLHALHGVHRLLSGQRD